MSMTEIRITREQVLATEAYKNLTPMLQKITRSRNQIQQIIYGVNVCKNASYKKWEKESNANWRTKEIVFELLKND